ncbi:MAG: class I SAM-dependent methyltransferase [Anaerolineae bacterium]|nr:class I SAM-dependent methyltransferase [Anaerolineae bacterium]
MTLLALWDIVRTQGYAGVREYTLTDALDCFYVALLAFGEGDIDRAAALAHRAASQDLNNRVYVQGAAYLDRVQRQGKAGVYVDGTAFAAFIRGGGNVGLYAAASRALRTVYDDYTSLAVLDVGVGDGLALLPALAESVSRVDLIEPSEVMLAKTTAALDTHGVTYTAANTTLQAFMASNHDMWNHDTWDAHGTWDMIQATWSLQSIHPSERPAAFEWFKAHGQRLLIAEFDVPDFADLYSPDRVCYILDHYQNGLAEYDGDGGLVAQGFLIPVMFGYFDRTADRTNWEGPITAWVEGLRAAGFESITTHKLFAYFWADAYMIDAR